MMMDASEGKSAKAPNGMHIPVLHAHEPSPEDYAGTTCYQAGYLVSKNAGWRSVRPVIDADACTGCLQCYMYCPDGTIRKSGEAASAAVFVDLDFCKGCGICAQVCAFDAITMIPESEVRA